MGEERVRCGGGHARTYAGAAPAWRRANRTAPGALPPCQGEAPLNARAATHSTRARWPQIGENEAAFSEKDQQAVEETYDAAMPFRDPGHISRDQIRFDKALQAEGVVKPAPQTLNPNP